MVGTVVIPKNQLSKINVQLTPLWLSNGRWAIHRSMLRDRALLTSTEAIEAYARGSRPTVHDSDMIIECIFAGLGTTIEWERTGTIVNQDPNLDPKFDLIEYQAIGDKAEGDKKAYFDRAYITTFEAKGNGVSLAKLDGPSDGRGPFVDKDKVFLLMPKVIDQKEKKP